MSDRNLSGQKILDMEHAGKRLDDIRLNRCAHCGGVAEFKAREKEKHFFWRVVCTGCGIGTWCTDDGYGHMDENGRSLAASEWNARAGKSGFDEIPISDKCRHCKRRCKGCGERVNKKTCKTCR